MRGPIGGSGCSEATYSGPRDLGLTLGGTLSPTPGNPLEAELSWTLLFPLHPRPAGYSLSSQVG